MAPSKTTDVENPKSSNTLDEILKVLKEIKGGDDDSIEVHQKALDDLVSVNSLFTIAVFVGLSLASPNIRSLENRPDCDADPGVAKRLIIYEVNSFACFLLSSLVAKSLKVALSIQKRIDAKKSRGDEDQDNIHQLEDNCLVPDRLCQKVTLSKPWKRVLLALSIVASFAGIVLLTLSMVNVIQIRVGKLSCGSDDAFVAVVSLCVIVLVALLFYAPSMVYAVIVTSNIRDRKKAKK